MASPDGLTLRERIAARGISSLDDTELLAVIMGEDTCSESATLYAERVMESCNGSLQQICNEDIARLRMIAGQGIRRAERIAAAAELGRRLGVAEADEVQYIESSEDIRKLFAPMLGKLPHEECWVVYLTSSNRIIDRRRISQGGIQGTVVDNRLVVKRALELLSPQIILVHNHPSGTAKPSKDDRTVTERLRDAAALFDIRLLDHIIISQSGIFSFLQEGLL